MFHPVAAVFFFFSESGFGRGLKLSRELRGSVGKKMVQLYRSTRLCSSSCFHCTL